MGTRLNKYLADRGVCSRREADRLIESRKVKVNGTPAALGVLVDDDDEIVVNGVLLKRSKPKPLFIAFHKPVGLITSADTRLRDNVISFLNLPERVFPIGRLDVASSGLLLMTNDGQLAEHITHPRYLHEKEYLVTVDKPLKRADMNKMTQGLVILGKKTRSTIMHMIDDKTFRLILTEGRNRQIRRMCEELGYEVRKLKRIRVMNIGLGDLAVGKWRHLDRDEVQMLQALASEE